MARLAAVGEICEDRYLPEGVARPGGIAANFAYHAGRAGADALLVAAVGGDEAGERLWASLADAPFDASRVRRSAGRSTVQRLRVEGGERVFCGYEPGVAAGLQLDADDERALAGCAVVACSDGLPHLLERCLMLGPRVVADFSRDTDGNEAGRPDRWLERWIDRLAIAFVGGDRTFLPALQSLSGRTASLIVLTAGADGAFGLRSGQVLARRADPVTVVDTNGCGDAFAGAFTAVWADGADLSRCLEAGAQRAAAVAAAYGAQPR